MLSIIAVIYPLVTLTILSTLTGNVIATGAGDLDMSTPCHLSCIINTGNLMLMAGEELGPKYIQAIQGCPSLCAELESRDEL